jgi:two-component system response regulator FixJ
MVRKQMAIVRELPGATKHFVDSHIARTVYVVDDDANVLRMMRLAIESIGHQVQSYASGTEFLASFDDSRRGCLILDLCMPGLSGIDVLRAMKSRGQEMTTIMISGRGSIPTAVQAIKAGAVTFLEKPYTMPDLNRAIAEALWTDEQMNAERQERRQYYHWASRMGLQEQKLLQLTVAGLPDKAIAARLNISVRTVQIRRRQMMDQAGVNSRLELVRYVTRSGDIVTSTSNAPSA